jgi:hypothetical protein
MEIPDKGVNMRTVSTWLLLLCGVPAAVAQQGRGSIAGALADPQGAVIQGARVVVRNTGTNASFETTTGEQGFYTAPGIPVGEYEVTAEHAGFKKSVRRGVTLRVDEKAQVDFVLEVGAVAETVEVAAEAQLVETSSPTVGKVVEARRIQELPLNGRNALALTLLTPSVKSNAGPLNSGFTDRGTQISSLSINGGPNSMNAQVLDGNTNILSYIGEVAIPPAVDAVEEFKVQSGTMSAEFGFTAGGVINLVTRSGTNQLHGSLYEFLRNDRLDARNTFALRKNPLRYNQFGGSAGGRIVRDRTFYFGNYEEYRLRVGSPLISSTMPLNQRSGDFSGLFDNRGVLIPVYDPNTTVANPAGAGFVRQPFAGNLIPAARLDPVAQKVLEFYPAPNRAPSDPFTNSNNFQRQGSSRIDSKQYHVKIDHRVNAKNSLFGRYSFFQHVPFGTGYFENPVGNSRNDDVRNRNLALSDTHTFTPTLINELRVGFARQYFTFISASFGQGWPQKLGLPASVPGDVFPTINFGYAAIGNGTVGARGSINWVFTDMVTKIQGRHTAKFGFEHRILRGNNRQSGSPSGSFAFNARLTGNPQAPAGTGAGPASFVLGSVASASGERVLGQSIHGYATSFFIQDDFKLTRRLTLNLGLRYDFQQQPLERNNGVSNFDPFTRDPVSGLLGRTVYANVDGAPRSFRPEDHNDFGPRFGFAWDARGNGRTVVRGGAAIFYPSIFYRNNFGSPAGFSNTSTAYTSPGSNPDLPAFQFRAGFPFPLIEPQGSKLGSNPFLGQGVSYSEADGTTPMSIQWNVSFQQQLPRRWLIDLAYSANRGMHFDGGSGVNNGYDFNQLDPQFLSIGPTLANQVPNPYAGRVPGSLGGATISRAQSLRPYPYYTGITVANPHLGSYTSHLFVASLEKRMSSGLTVLVSYTAGKIISDGVATPVDFGLVEQTNENSFQNGKFDRRANRSVDPTDISQRSVTSILYELPFGEGKKWKGASGNRLIGGWQLNSISIFQTGLPLIVRGATSTLGTANRPNSTGKSARLDNRTAQRWFDGDQFVNPPDFTFGNVGRVLPDVRGPGTVNLDFSVIKNTKLREGLNLQFRAESFNVLNHVNLSQPNASFVAGADGRNRSGTFGLITSARDARVGQFGLKLLF